MTGPEFPQNDQNPKLFETNLFLLQNSNNDTRVQKKIWPALIGKMYFACFRRKLSFFGRCI